MRPPTRKSSKNRGIQLANLAFWTAVASALIAAVAGIFTAVQARKSQAETNNLTGTNFEVERYRLFTNEVQEERDKAKAELKEERDQHKNDITQLRKDFEAFKLTTEQFKLDVQIKFSSYRAYIHGLRGQVHELGGVPIEWPENLEQ